jgi:hypothetical protein
MTSGIRRLWTPEEDQQMLDWRAEGRTMVWIGAQLASNHASISTRLAILNGQGHVRLSRTQQKALPPPPPPPHPGKPGPRKCLCCGLTFPSSHAGNRICWRCKQRSVSDNHRFCPG